jgi:hypothetical protein
LTGWEVFKGWHREQSFWREVYARTVAGLSTVFVVFVVGVAVGAITLTPRDGVFMAGTVVYLLGALGVVRLLLPTLRRLVAPGRAHAFRFVLALFLNFAVAISILVVVSVTIAIVAKPWLSRG